MLPSALCGIFLVLVTLAFQRVDSSPKPHVISKRQITSNPFLSNPLAYQYGAGALAPVIPVYSYSFTASCTAGNVIGTATASSGAGTPPYFSIDPGQGSFTNVAVNPTTGQITMCTSATGAFSFNLRAANSYGADVVPVTVTCNSGTTTTTNTGLLYGSTCSNSLYGGSSLYGSYPYSTGISPYGTSSINPYSTGITNPYTSSVYPYTSGITSPYTSYPYAGSANPYPTGITSPYTSYPYTGSANPYSTGITPPYTGYPYGTGTSYPYTGLTGSIPYTGVGTYPSTGTTSTGPVTFSQPGGYRFSTTTCTSGSIVGTVTTTGGSGLQLISGGGGAFSISPIGQITVSGTLYSGTYSLVFGVPGSTTSQVPVTITASCNNSGFTPVVFG